MAIRVISNAKVRDCVVITTLLVRVWVVFVMVALCTVAVVRPLVNVFVWVKQRSMQFARFGFCCASLIWRVTCRANVHFVHS